MVSTRLRDFLQSKPTPKFKSSILKTYRQLSVSRRPYSQHFLCPDLEQRYQRISLSTGNIIQWWIKFIHIFMSTYQRFVEYGHSFEVVVKLEFAYARKHWYKHIVKQKSKRSHSTSCYKIIFTKLQINTYYTTIVLRFTFVIRFVSTW